MANDVAYALLDATRRMSISTRARTDSFGSSIGHDDHTISSSLGSSSGGGWFDKWKSNTELDVNNDSLHSLPKDTGSWFPVQRNRAYSESYNNNSASEQNGRPRLGSFGGRGGWFAPGPGFTAKKVSEMKTGATGFSDRKTSHKEIEEALAGGLNKADIYMPPI